MGYTTDFTGLFQVDRPLDKETKELLQGLARTRRMKRDLSMLARNAGISLEEALERWGEDGELYFNPDDFENMGQTRDASVVGMGNNPPKGQPSLWLQWLYREEEWGDKTVGVIRWDGGEKFYQYVEWIRYLINRILKPRGYVLEGSVEWQGEDSGDQGKILVRNNLIKTQSPVVQWVTDSESE